MILGIDISSNVVGYSCFSNDQLIRYGFVDISNVEGLFFKVDVFLVMFDCDANKIDEIFVEDIQQTFARGFSSINTTILLAKMNAALSYAIHNKFRKKVEYINVNHARKVIGLTVRRNGIKAKDQTFDYICVKFGRELSFKSNKNDNIDKRMSDITDAITIGLAGSIIGRRK